MISDDDLLLYYYRDGLDATERARIATALAEQPELAQRLHRLVAQLDTAAIAEADARAVASQAWSAERVYEREWAETLLRQVLDRLAEECALAGKDELFKQLNSHLSVSSEAAVPYEEMSLRLGRPITTLRSDVARLRSRYRAILREEVGGTVAEASEVDAELRHLCEVLAAD